MGVERKISDDQLNTLLKDSEAGIIDALQGATEYLWRMEVQKAAYERAKKNKKKLPEPVLDLDIELQKREVLTRFSLKNHRVLLNRYQTDGDEAKIASEQTVVQGLMAHELINDLERAQLRRDWAVIDTIKDEGNEDKMSTFNERQKEVKAIESSLNGFSPEAHKIALFVLEIEAERVQIKLYQKQESIHDQKVRIKKMTATASS